MTGLSGRRLPHARIWLRAVGLGTVGLGAQTDGAREVTVRIGPEPDERAGAAAIAWARVTSSPAISMSGSASVGVPHSSPGRITARRDHPDPHRAW